MLKAQLKNEAVMLTKATKATALRARSEALQKEEQALRERFGLTR